MVHTKSKIRADKKNPLWRADSLVSCGRKADSYKKNMRFQKYPDSCGRGLNLTRKTLPSVHDQVSFRFDKLFAQQLSVFETRFTNEKLD